MIKIGDYNVMEVARFTASGAYLRSGDEEALLPKKFADPSLQPGDRLEVFVYNDSEDRITATTQKPKARVGEFAYLKTIDANQFGAFLDWGLDKDLMVPFSEQLEKMVKGKKYVVRVALDYKTRRIIGSSKVRDFFLTDVSNFKLGQKVELMVFGETDLGIKVIIDNQYEGLLYKNEVFEPLGVGEKAAGYIKKIREDGKLDVTLYKAGMEGVRDSETLIIDRLKQAGGYLPFNDSTPPEIIKDELMMSKKMFKKAIGGLYKTGIITFKENGFVLNEIPSKPVFAKTKKKDEKDFKPVTKRRIQQPSIIKKQQDATKGSEKKPGEKKPLASRITRKKE